MTISLTPAQKISWTMETLFERAKDYIRTSKVCDFLETKDYRPSQIEHTASKEDIAVLQCSTDDNPILSLESIEQMISGYDDPDIEATRRYGIHKQYRGRIFKDFDYPIHFIDRDEYFPDGVPDGWRHARVCDYHAQTPWAMGCISLSPENEAFIWKEYNPSPEKFTTLQICETFISMCGDYRFDPNLIDPQAEAVKKDTISILSDINRIFHELKREGTGTGGHWVTWDSKGEKGRDSIKERLKNAKAVGKPHNNKSEDGRYLPTLWVLNCCPITAKHLKMWRWTEYADIKTKLIKGQTTDKTEQKFSHFCTAFESVFKHLGFRPKSMNPTPRIERKSSYFRRR